MKARGGIVERVRARGGGGSGRRTDSLPRQPGPRLIGQSVWDIAGEFDAGVVPPDLAKKVEHVVDSARAIRDAWRAVLCRTWEETTYVVMSQRAALRISRARSSRDRLFRFFLLVASVGLSLSLAGCGSSSPSKPYQQGWDRAVTSPGYDCNTVPGGIGSASDWTKGCRTGQGFLNAHETTGHYPSPTPTTYPGDP